MTTQTTTAVITVGKNAGVVLRMAYFDTTSEIVTAALSEIKQGYTVGILPAMPVNKKANIAAAEEVVALVQAELQKQNKPKGENKTMTNTTPKHQGPFKTREEWASAQENKVSSVTVHHNMDRAARNSNVGRFQSHAETVAAQRFMDLGEYAVTIVGIEWFAKADRFGRLGAVTAKLPVGFADVSFYDNNLRKSEWYDFCDFDMNQFKTSFNPPAGSGLLTLAIKENGDGELSVKLPKTKGKKEGQYFDKLRVRDIRFGFPHSDNNSNLEAAISAYVRFYAGEFKQAHPVNRQGISEDCTTCKSNLYVPGYDNMDNEKDGYYNTLNTSDTIEMVQWGQEIPRRFCMVHRELVDLEIVKEINELAAHDQREYYDEEGQLRYARPNELVIAGKAVNKYVALKEGTADRCADCPFYHNNAAKTEKQIAKEKAEGKEYVSKYWSEQADADRMAIQTLTHNGKHGEWVTEFPGAVDGALDFRVYGIGGVVVYGSEEVSQAAYEGGVLNQVPVGKEENKDQSYASKVANIIYHMCNDFSKVTEDSLDRLFEMIEAKPAGLSARMERRWESSMARLMKTIQENQA